jgi:hypothetical protein
VSELQREPVSRGIGRRLAKAGVVAVAVATMGSAGLSGALAQQSDDIYGGGMAVGSDVAGESVPAPAVVNPVTSPADTIEVPAVESPAPEVVNAVLGEEETPAPVDLGVLGVEPPAPVDLSVLGEGMPAPVDISAIFEGLNLPAPAGVAEREIGPDISVGGTPGGSASGTITMGGGGEEGISMGGGTGGGGVYGG